MDEEMRLEQLYDERREMLTKLMRLALAMDAITEAARKQYDEAIKFTVDNELDGDWGFDVTCNVKQHLENTKATLDRFIEDF